MGSFAVPKAAKCLMHKSAAAPLRGANFKGLGESRRPLSNAYPIPGGLPTIPLEAGWIEA
jgi:hypothetical protein